MLVVVNEYVVEDARSKKVLEGSWIACESGSCAGVKLWSLVRGGLINMRPKDRHFRTIHATD
jgi:hypothetical protein